MKPKRVHGEFLLPEAIIQHVQSFLNGKEAARTTILSKSWRTAWKTRPNLYFDQRGFMRNSGDRDGENEFWKLVNRTVQRYEKLNLKIVGLSLWIYGSYFDRACSYSLATKLILKAMKLGAVDLDFSVDHRNRLFELPIEVLDCENLIRLSVNGCKIGVGRNGKIKCSRLESLRLGNVWLEGDILWDIISKCPLIEKLSLRSCRFLDGTQSSGDVVFVTDSSMLALNPFNEFGRRNLGLVVDKPVISYEIHKLKCLSLYGVTVHAFFFDEFASKFPCLVVLGLHDCDNNKDIRISSTSLECINITQGWELLVKLDVPNIRRFTFTSEHIPCLLLKTGRSNWESHISITCHSPCATVGWFRKLNKLLTKLSLSRVSLSLEILYWNRIKYAGNIQGLSKPVVENLSVDAPSSTCPALFDCLFRCCRPIFVTQLRHPKWSIGGERNMEFLEVIYKGLIQQISLKFLDNKSNHIVLCQDDLEEVSVEVFNEAVYGWRTLHWKSVLDASKDEQKIRFHLRWGREPATFEDGKRDMTRRAAPFIPGKRRVFKPKPIREKEGCLNPSGLPASSSPKP